MRLHFPRRPTQIIGIASAIAFLLSSPFVTSSVAQAPATPTLTRGRNVNMAGGSQVLQLDPYEVRGDVLGRAQNEPSCAISTRNPQHILCGSNDYRMVDVPGVTETQLIRDAWLGVFQSADAGDTWESTLYGGFFLDPATHPLKSLGFRAAADPVVRSGPAGLAWYAGIAFTTDKSRSALHVTTFADLNNRENDPMPFKPARTTIVDQVAAPQFIDKPWMFVEAAPTPQMCSLRVPAGEPAGATSTKTGQRLQSWIDRRWPGWQPQSTVVQTVPASIIHIVYTVFLDGDDKTAAIMYTRSDNCGQTFTRPRRLNPIAEGAVGLNEHGNGATITKPLVTGSGRVFATWRRVRQQTSTGEIPDAIMSVVSDDNGRTWSAPQVVEEICPFEQGTTATSFRTTAFPTMTADAGGRAYVAWSDRRQPNGACIRDAKGTPIGAGRIRVATSTDGVTWSSFVAVPSSTPEHQMQPSLAFTAGRLFLAWVDFREDASGVFGQFVNEAEVLVNTPAIRHTGDVRASMALPGSAPAFAAGATIISEYLKGVVTIGGRRIVGQIQWNAPNRRWARKGMVPFYGDYIDIATMPYLPPTPGSKERVWQPNNQLTRLTPAGPVPLAPSLLLAWSDNRDMRAAPGVDNNPAIPVPYVTPAGLQLPSQSIFDPTQTRPVCSVPQDAYKTGTTNQNAYSSRLSIGFVAAAPGNNKDLGALQRAFVIFVRNETEALKAFRLAATAPPGGFAAFDQFDPSKTVLDVNVPARSSVARTVYVSRDPTSQTSLDPNASVPVDVIELQGVTPVQATTILLNGDASAPEIDSPEIDSKEIFTPEIDSAQVMNLGFASPEIDSPEIDSPEIDSNTLRSLGLGSPEIDSPEIDSPEIDSPEIDSPEIDSPEIDSAAITDALFSITNTGNTVAQYNAKAFVKAVPGKDFRYQVIVRRRYELPAVNQNCEPTTIPVSKVAVNLQDVSLGTPEIDSPEIDSSAPGTASFFLAPSEVGEVIVRVRSASGETLTPAAFELAAQPESVNSDDAAAGITEPPIVTTYLSVATQAVPAALTGAFYQTQLAASGEVGLLTWAVAGGSGILPPGLTLSAAGLISGIPAASGSFPFIVQVTDSSVPPQTATREVTISVTAAGVASLAFVTQPTDALVGEILDPPVSVRAIGGNGSPVAGVSVSLQLIGAGTLLGTLTRQTGSTGIAVFNDLSVNTAGANRTLSATAAGYAPATSVPFSVGMPDLAVALTHSPAAPTTTDTIVSTAVVTNIGTATAGPTTLLFVLPGETAGSTTTLVAVPSLAPGQGYTVTRSFTATSSGSTSVTATANFGGAVPEGNTANNTATDSFQVLGTAGLVFPGDPAWSAIVPAGTAAEISGTNPRSGLGSLEFVTGINRSAAFVHAVPAPGLGTFGELNALTYDWFIDQESMGALAPSLLLRVYEATDPRTFFVGWAACNPLCVPQPKGVWQTSNVMSQLALFRGEGGALPASFTEIPPDAPIVGVQIFGNFAFGGPWFGFADNVTIGFTGRPPTVFNFEVTNPAQRRIRPAITWNNPSAIQAGTQLSAAQLNAASQTTGTFTYDPAAQTVLPPDFHILSTSFTPADSSQYLPTAKIVPLTVTGLRVVLPPGTPWFPFLPEATSFAAITGANPRAGAGSLELRKELGQGSAMIREQRRLPLGRLNQLSELSYDWFIDPTSTVLRPPQFALRVYEFGDPRSFFLWWNTCPPGAPCPIYPAGVWQTTNLMGQLSLQGADGNPPPASLEEVPPDAPITGIHVRAEFANGQPWRGFADNVTIAFGGTAPIVYNFEVPAAPTITPTVSGTAGGGGWYRSAVSVTWTIVDAFGIASSTGCDPVTLTNDTAGQTLTCTAVSTSGAGASSSITIKIDRTAPVNAGPAITPPPNAAGWNNTVPVTVAFAGNDVGAVQSGGVTCTQAVLNEDTAGTALNGVCSDLAGNQSATVVATVRIDRSPPVVTFGPSNPPLPPDGVYHSDVIIPFTATDALSGLGSSLPVPIYLSGDDESANRIMRVDPITGAVFNLYVGGSEFRPGALAVSPLNGKLYVAQPDSARILRMDQTGLNVEVVYDRAFASAPNNPAGADGLGFSANGDLYFISRTPTAGVWRIALGAPGSVAQQLFAIAAPNGLGEGIAVNAAGDVFVADPPGNRIIRANAPTFVPTTFVPSTSLPCPVEPPEVPQCLFGIAVDAAGAVYVANHGVAGIQRFDSSGASLGTFVTFAAPQVPFLTQFDGDGHLWVVTASNVDADSLAGIWRVNPAGQASQVSLVSIPDAAAGTLPVFSGGTSFGTLAFQTSGTGIVSATDRASNAVQQNSATVTIDAGSAPADLTVSTTADAGSGSLRQAILNANARGSGVPETITFTLAPGNRTISPLTSLPAITVPVVLDATQPGFSGTPVVELSGALAGSGGIGLAISGGASTVRGFVINRWRNAGIQVTEVGQNQIAGNYIGTDVAGSAGPPSTFEQTTGVTTHNQTANNVGIRVFSPSNTIGGTTPADRNVISGNTQSGISVVPLVAPDGVTILNSGTGTFIYGNYIGTDATGTAAKPNGVLRLNNGVPVAAQNSGILVAAPHVVIGGSIPGAGNVISGNATGISAQATTSGGAPITSGSSLNIQGNRIGTNAAGTGAIPFSTLPGLTGGHGIVLNAPDAVIGGSIPGSGNVISGNYGSGVITTAQRNGAGAVISVASNAMLQGNLIGTNAAGTAALPNAIGITVFAPGARIGGTTAAARNVISGNTGNGININRFLDAVTSALVSEGTNAVIEGNYVGVDVTGAAVLGNGNSGIFVGAANATIGGTTPGAANVLAANGSSAVLAPGVTLLPFSDGSQVLGNYIGTNPAGTPGLGNWGSGVQITNASNVTVGSPGSGRNVISGGRRSGINVSAATTAVSGVQISGNYVGVAPDGNTALGNLINGVSVNVSGTGTVPGMLVDQNVISGNTGLGFTANRGTFTITGNRVGTNAAGTAAVPNSSDGISLSDVTSSTIGGTTPQARNVISGNLGSGVRIASPVTAATGNTVRGNYIGTNADGTAAIANGGNGVFLTSSPGRPTSGNVIGGTTASARNLISGNALAGVFILGSDASGNVVAGNYIGTDFSGTVAIPNVGLQSGVSINSAPNNVVGGNTAGERNVISGNAQHAVTVSGAGATGNTIHGNYIGVDATGAQALPNGGIGVDVVSAPNTTIGGAGGAGNVISGNGTGIQLRTGVTGTLVQGNFIGTNAAGVAAIPNRQMGIRMSDADSNTIGGTSAGTGNLIAGNGTPENFAIGIWLGDGSTSNVVQGNRIGAIGPNGAAPLPNTGDGVRIENSNDNRIGGTEAGAGNVVSGNAGSGVFASGIALAGTSSGNIIQGNRIGTDTTGTVAVGNNGFGISVAIGGVNNLIGGTPAGAGNTIAFNAFVGIHVLTGTGTAIRANSIHSNGFLGIDLFGSDLGGGSVSPNDAGDVDAGANNLQNFPVVAQATAGSTGVSGTFNSAPITAFTLEFFASSACDPLGFGEGQRFLGSLAVTTDATGNATYSGTLPGVTTAGEVVTATATDPAGNTSEFSQCRVVTSGS